MGVGKQTPLQVGRTAVSYDKKHRHRERGKIRNNNAAYHIKKREFLLTDKKRVQKINRNLQKRAQGGSVS